MQLLIIAASVSSGLMFYFGASVILEIEYKDYNRAMISMLFALFMTIVVSVTMTALILNWVLI